MIAPVTTGLRAKRSNQRPARRGLGCFVARAPRNCPFNLTYDGSSPMRGCAGSGGIPSRRAER